MRSLARCFSHASLLALVFVAVGCSSTQTQDAPATAPSADPTTAPPAATDLPPPPAPNALATAIDALFTDAESKDTFSGSVIVVDGGKQVFEKGYGFADRDSKRKNTPDTIFRVGSVSKQFAATAILALVQDGKISLTDPVSKFFPDYPKESLVMDGQEVTLHHLISHTSGLPDPGATTGFKAIAWRRPIAPSEQVDFVKALPLLRKPGSDYEYVNYNFLLAAMIVEQVAAQPYETFLRTRFFTPLGMKDTGTVLPASLASREAVGYAKDSTGFYTLNDDAAFKDPDVTLAFGAGQIYSTVRDLALWDRALTGEKILKAAERDLLWKPNLDDYGYGWVIQKKSNVTMEWHNGALSPLGFTALIVRVPTKDRFVAYLANMNEDLITPFEAKVEALVVK